MRKIKSVILDWAGTTVDYGCFAPVNAFIAAFESYGIKAGIDETRAPMGLAKKKHIEKMLETPSVMSQWVDVYGRCSTQEDIDKIYARFEPALFETLRNHAEPICGALDAVAKIRDMGIVIGSTTGYTRAMMDVVAPLAKEKGYAPDCLVCPEDVNGMGRPYPYMLWRNLEKLGVESIEEVIKIGDTVADIEEGKNAGCISVGVLTGSSMLGLSEDEASSMSGDELTDRCVIAKQKYIVAGADYVIKNIGELPSLIKSINNEREV